MLEVRNLSKTAPNGKQLLDRVTFSVGKGEFVGILGPSGAGKSLTMRCITGLTKPSGGDVLFTGESGKVYRTSGANASELRRARRNIGMIFQGSNLVKRLSVLENVMIGRLGRIRPLRSWLYGFTDAEAAEAMTALERVEMSSFAARPAGSLSGGEMQRVAIARAIFQRPLLYLADEPIASLDPRNSEAIMRLLEPLAQESPILGAFHQPEITQRYCSRILALRAGQIVYDGPPVLDQASLAAIYGASAAPKTPAWAARAPVPANAAVCG